MRRRLFWTIAGVAAATGVLVLTAAVLATQRAAVDATYRELSVSAQEAVDIIEETLRGGSRPGAILEMLRLLEGDQLGPLFNRIRRTAGGSEIGFAVVTPNGVLRSNASLFDRIALDRVPAPGETLRTSSGTGELVVVSATDVEVRNGEVTLLVGLARSAPIIRLRDQRGVLVLLTAGIVVLAAIGARFLSTQLARRLEPLAAASRRVAAGDMKARVPEIGDQDLDVVGSAFNEMATELEASREREREFILGVGHDLRTPLTTIGGYAEALESGGYEPGDLARMGTVLGTQSRQLGRLIEDLTTLARLEQTEFDLRIETVDVGAHVAEVVEGFTRRSSELGIELVVAVEPGLFLDTDPDRLGQIAQNLVENALRHTPEAGRVKVSVTGDGETISLAVVDSGPGIAPDDLPYIFDRHYVGRQRRLRNEGSGLGLSIVKGLVDRMGGEVTAHSSPGAGTTVTVRFAR